MNGDVSWIILVVIGLMGAGGFIIAQITRSQQLLQKWATENGYQLVQAQARPFPIRSPFSWSSKNQRVYQVVVQDEQGNERGGWLRLGGYSSGLLSDQVEVRWDE
jgi:hypothetical protein